MKALHCRLHTGSHAKHFHNGHVAREKRCRKTRRRGWLNKCSRFPSNRRCRELCSVRKMCAPACMRIVATTLPAAEPLFSRWGRSFRPRPQSPQGRLLILRPEGPASPGAGTAAPESFAGASAKLLPASAALEERGSGKSLSSLEDNCCVPIEFSLS
ncbi:uncharacterized protein ACOB8E_023753 [Sarcophilus harrisii]